MRVTLYELASDAVAHLVKGKVTGLPLDPVSYTHLGACGILKATPHNSRLTA